MMRSLYTSASGMRANQLYVDSISNNLANVNTVGFKKSRLEFQDLLYQTLVQSGAATGEGGTVPGSLQVGLGTRAVGNSQVFTQGNLEQTGNPLHVAVEGPGFFVIQQPDGSLAYTRNGSFKLDANGNVVTSQGLLLHPPVIIPMRASEIGIDGSGRVTAILEGDSVATELGQLELAQFLNPSGLRSLGSNLHAQTEASGEALRGLPGENGTGRLTQSFLETSNVQLVEEMVNLIIAQRAYEISSRAVQTSDEMLQLASNLRR